MVNTWYDTTFDAAVFQYDRFDGYYAEDAGALAKTKIISASIDTPEINISTIDTPEINVAGSDDPKIIEGGDP